MFLDIGDVVYLEKLNICGMFIGDGFYFVSSEKKDKCKIIRYDFNGSKNINTNGRFDFFKNVYDPLMIINEVHSHCNFYEYVPKNRLIKPFDIVTCDDSPELYLYLGDLIGYHGLCLLLDKHLNTHFFLKRLCSFAYDPRMKFIHEHFKNMERHIFNLISEKCYDPHTPTIKKRTLFSILLKDDEKTPIIFISKNMNITISKELLNCESISRLLEGEEIIIEPQRFDCRSIGIKLNEEED